MAEAASLRADPFIRREPALLPLRRAAELSLIAITNVVPLAGVLLLDWSLLETMLLVWIHAAIILMWAGVRLVARSPAIGILGILVGGPIASILLVLQLSLIVLWFALDAAREDFFGLVEGLPALGERLAWAAAAMFAFEALAFAWQLRSGAIRAKPTWLVAAAPIVHVVLLQVVVSIAAFGVRDAGEPRLGLVALVVLGTLVDLGFYFAEERMTRPRAVQASSGIS